MSATLSGHNALITGGGSGIGLACAIAFARDGAAVTLMGRNRDKLQSAAESIRANGGAAEIAAGDVGNEADVIEAVKVAERLGPLMIANRLWPAAARRVTRMRAPSIRSQTTAFTDLSGNVRL